MGIRIATKPDRLDRRTVWADGVIIGHVQRAHSRFQFHPYSDEWLSADKSKLRAVKESLELQQLSLWRGKCKSYSNAGA